MKGKGIGAEWNRTERARSGESYCIVGYGECTDKQFGTISAFTAITR